MITIAVVDPSKSFRQNLHRLFESFGASAEGFETGSDYLSSSIFQNEHVALIALSLPDIDGVDLLRMAKQQSLAQVVFAVMNEPSVPLTVRAMRAGAADVFLKPVPLEPVLRASQLGSAFTNDLARNSETLPASKPLSKREREVLDLLIAGKSSREIAEVFGISVRTAEAHRKNIYQKTGVHSQGELARKLNC